MEEARNAAPATHLSVSSQRYPFTEDAFIELLQSPEANRYQFSIREVDMDAVIDDVYDHRADIGVICLTELTEKIIFRFLDSRALGLPTEIAEVDPCVSRPPGPPPWRNGRR